MFSRRVPGQAGICSVCFFKRMFMFGKIHGRFNLGTRRMRFAALAGICAAGLAIGTFAGTLLAQLSGGNPTSQTETPETPCCLQTQGCGSACVNYSQGDSVDVVNFILNNNPWTTCSLEQVPVGTSVVQCLATTATRCGTIYTWDDPGCVGGWLDNPQPLSEPNCGRAPACR